MGCMQSVPVLTKDEGKGRCTAPEKTPEQCPSSASKTTSCDTPRTQLPQTPSPNRHNHHLPTKSEQDPTHMVSVVREAVDDWNLVYEQINRPDQPNVPLIKFTLPTKHTQCTVILSLDLEDEVFAVYWMCPSIKVIESKRTTVSRYLAAVNYDIMLGHWDLDVRDGEVRFKLSQVVQGTRLSKDMVQQMIGVALKTFDRYLPGVMVCQFGGLSAEEALIETRRLEAEADSPPPATPQQ